MKKGMRRAFVSLPDGVWKIIDRDFRKQIGEGDSEVIRNMVIAYLSDKGYFINEKGAPTIEDIDSRINVLENMITSLSEILEEKGSITLAEWDSRIKRKLERSTKI